MQSKMTPAIHSVITDFIVGGVLECIILKSFPNIVYPIDIHEGGRIIETLVQYLSLVKVKIYGRAVGLQ